MIRKYFLTHGRGTQQFVISELKDLIESDSFLDDSVEGKIVFSTKLPIDHLIRLKTIERLFLCLHFVNFSDRRDDSKSDPHQLIEQSIQTIDRDLFESIEFKSLLNDPKRACPSRRFRCNCKLTGSFRKSKWIRKDLSDKLTAKLKQVDARCESDANDPDFELIFHLTDACLAFGVQLTREPLSRRSYIRHVGLRSTICSAMLRLADLQSDDSTTSMIVLDPFCGKSTIFAEYFGASSSSHRKHFLIGADSSEEQLISSVENLGSNASLIRSALIRQFPYRNESIDLIISDLPFGRNHPKHFYDESNEKFYADSLREFKRMLRKPEGCAILLINSQEVSQFEKAVNCLNANDCFFQVSSKHALSLGETSAVLFKINLVLKKQ